ncbi:EF-P 5-aminopentanol modification-associated protein YfmF [Ornithinibacillus gellani]|uniref:EF-P 5-aminopentanol modification-associated protein YfmF n=1 Tax=Ornithinibacillus gellani TaxID=2293253 RepID=UPI001680DF33|nr:pitrilysin family protein [Ornithinibacillus gellani]
MKALLHEQTVDVCGLKLHLIPSKQFKTATISLKIKGELKRDTITSRSLLPMVLRQGSKTYPNTTLLAERLDDLYGAALSLGGMKRGTYHILETSLEVANQKYIENEDTILRDALSLLKEIVFVPKIENGAFDKEIVEREKETIRQRLRSLLDDKMSFANMRLIDEMFAGHPYQIRAEGYESDLDDITGETLYTTYQQLLQEDEVDLYLVGDLDMSEVTALVSEIFQDVLPENRVRTTKHAAVKENAAARKQIEIMERQKLQQAKLHIGYRTNTTFGDPDFAALQVFNSVLGGGPGSKLFLNVREKHSLAYYVGSGFDSLQDLLIIYSGIAPEDYEKALQIIRQEFEDIRSDQFTDQELNENKTMLINGFYADMEHAHGIIDLTYMQQLGGSTQTPEETVAAIQAVSREDVVRMAHKVEEDTVYLLTSEVSE